MRRIPADDHNQSAKSSRMPGVCMTSAATSENGVTTFTKSITTRNLRRKIRADRRKVRPKLCGAGPGASNLKAAVRVIATMKTLVMRMFVSGMTFMGLGACASYQAVRKGRKFPSYEGVIVLLRDGSCDSQCNTKDD